MANCAVRCSVQRHPGGTYEPGRSLDTGSCHSRRRLGSPRRSLLFDPKFSVWLDRITLMRDRIAPDTVIGKRLGDRRGRAFF
jgi:hypothetical protein